LQPGGLSLCCGVGRVMGRPRVTSYCKANYPRALFAPARRAVSRKLGACVSSFISRCFLRFRDAQLFAVLTLAAALCGCSASRVIDLYAADYRETVATAGDSQLLLNILRTRDNLPIHFSDLSIIHGSIQLTAGNTTSVPFANFTAPAAIASNVAPVVSAQSSPTFDLGTLDTQDFTKGILSPINPQIIKQLFDQGIDPRIIMLLFFSEYQNPDKQRFLNNMACDLNNPGRHPERGCYSYVYDYLGQIDGFFRRNNIGLENGRKQLQANIYVTLTPVGGALSGPWTLDNLSDLSGLDTKKFKLEGKQLYSISDPQLAICYYERDHTLHALFPSILGDATCNQSQIKIFRPHKPNAGLSVRSTYEMLQFLGQVLRFQEETTVQGRCLTLDEHDRRCDTGAVLFQVNAPVGTPVVTTRYGDAVYAIHDRNCNRLFDQPCDYSLQVLAILELLLNANKVASDIPSTPRVQFVP
jgi:hypothetical protein